MIELAPADRALAIPLFQPYAHMRHAIWAVFEGRQAGRVFVDDAVHPRHAALWHHDGYLAGEPDEALAREAADLVRRLGLDDHPHVYIFAADARWLDLMAPLLACAVVRRIVQSTFRFDAELWASRHRDWRRRIPADCEVARLDARLADYPGIVKLWGSVEHFISAGFGYAVLRRGERVTKAQTVFVGAGFAELGLDTLPACQRQGYGRLAACALIEHALAAGLTPTWCAYDNPASVGLALDLGFAPTEDWPVLYLPGDSD
jgi:GNAT superfamily N-acetyltransferase